jgi:hypothetical protein
MAFTNETLAHVGGTSPAPRIYTYYTEDTQATVTAARRRLLPQITSMMRPQSSK